MYTSLNVRDIALSSSKDFSRGCIIQRRIGVLGFVLLGSSGIETATIEPSQTSRNISSSSRIFSIINMRFLSFFAVGTLLMSCQDLMYSFLISAAIKPMLLLRSPGQWKLRSDGEFQAKSGEEAQRFLGLRTVLMTDLRHSIS